MSKDTNKNVVFKGPYEAGERFLVPRNQALREGIFVVANHATREMLMVWQRGYGQHPDMYHPNILSMDNEDVFSFWRRAAGRYDNFITNGLIRSYTAGKIPKYWYEMVENQASEYTHLLDKYEPKEAI